MTKRSKVKRTIPFWLQIVLILMAGVFVSIGSYAVIHYYKNSRTEQKPTHTVTFAYPDGTVIDSKQVQDGHGVIPPVIEALGIFRGWSSSVNNITSDIEVHPLLQEAVDENLFCFNSVYVEEGSDFEISLLLTGNVNLSAADIALEYDPEVMSFSDLEANDDLTVIKNENGHIELHLESKIPITQETLISELRFHAEEKDVLSTIIEISCSNAILIKDGLEKNATVSSMNNKIYYLQEVN